MRGTASLVLRTGTAVQPSGWGQNGRCAANGGISYFSSSTCEKWRLQRGDSGTGELIWGDSVPFRVEIWFGVQGKKAFPGVCGTG